ncbi:MAG TPA: DUF262 domain-containing protein [Vicingus sp.]|nr:DUF262 domain-containing protein [Vicingus sp.]
MDIYQKAEEQIVEKQKIVDFDIKEFTIELLINKYLTGIESDDNDIFIPTYQRNFVWDIDRQSKFIESVLLGLPIPYIFSADTEGRLEIVDGSQRLRTLVAFYSSNLILKNLEILTSLNGFKYSDLIKSRQRKFLNSTIRMIALSDKSDEDVRFMMFERINTGSAILKDMEKRKGIFGGKFMDFVYNDCSKHPLFIRNTKFTERLEKRGEPQELIIRFFAYSDNYKLVKTGVNEFLNEFVDSKNKSFDKVRYNQEFDNMLKFVDKYFPDGFIKSKNSNKTPRVRFDAISVGVNLALRENPKLKPTDLSWLNSKQFNELITKGGQNAPTAIKERIEFVYNKLING